MQNFPFGKSFHNLKEIKTIQSNSKPRSFVRQTKNVQNVIENYIVPATDGYGAAQQQNRIFHFR